MPWRPSLHNAFAHGAGHDTIVMGTKVADAAPAPAPAPVATTANADADAVVAGPAGAGSMPAVLAPAGQQCLHSLLAKSKSVGKQSG